MGAALSPPLTDSSYLDARPFPSLTARISTPAINATSPSTALPPLYKHPLLASNGAHTLDLDRAPRITQTLDLAAYLHHDASPSSTMESHRRNTRLSHWSPQATSTRWMTMTPMRA
jgi:hypothetical protein